MNCLLFRFFRSLFRTSIHDVHGPVRSDGRPCLDAFNDSLADVRNLLFFVLVEFTENITDLLAASEFVADADADSCVILSADKLVDVCKPVVSSCASVLAESQCTERYVKVIRDDKEVCQESIRISQITDICPFSTEPAISYKELPAPTEFYHQYQLLIIHF